MNKICLSYNKEPGKVYEYIKRNGIAYARIRATHTGKELWRARSPKGSFPEINAHKCDFNTMYEFINTMEVKGLQFR